jgi:phage tail tape-measure protein
VFLLSLLNAGLLSVKKVSAGLQLTAAHVRDLARRLEHEDVAALMDQRRGQTQEYRMTPTVTGRLIEQFAAHALTGKPTSSIVLAQELSKDPGFKLSDRTIRLHARKLGFAAIVQSLPKRVADIKKNSSP